MMALGEGAAEQFAPDDKSLLVSVPSTPPQLWIYPVGVGQSMRLDRGEFENISDAKWIGDGQKVLVSGNLPGGSPRCFVLDVQTNATQAVGPQGIRAGYPDPQGTRYVALTKSGWAIFPMSGESEGIPLPALVDADKVVRWDLEGTAVLVFQRAQIPCLIDRVEVDTGRRETALRIADDGTAGIVSVLGLGVANDLKSVAYAIWDFRSTLYTARAPQL
jgi:dipeptidyl aminopeptidase/acylaminoacyl peptidase